jgi:hypothetical protein
MLPVATEGQNVIMRTVIILSVILLTDFKLCVINLSVIC